MEYSFAPPAVLQGETQQNLPLDEIPYSFSNPVPIQFFSRPNTLSLEWIDQNGREGEPLTKEKSPSNATNERRAMNVEGDIPAAETIERQPGSVEQVSKERKSTEAQSSNGSKPVESTACETTADSAEETRTIENLLHSGESGTVEDCSLSVEPGTNENMPSTLKLETTENRANTVEPGAGEDRPLSRELGTTSENSGTLEQLTNKHSTEVPGTNENRSSELKLLTNEERSSAEELGTSEYRSSTPELGTNGAQSDITGAVDQ